MDLLLKRDLKTSEYSAGSLSVDGAFQCWTLEDTERDLSDGCANKIKSQTAIPKGKYEVIISFSNRFKKFMPLLLAVPCFEGIRIHSGNKPEDSEGCILVGKEKSAAGTISESRIAFKELMAILTKAVKKEKIFITVE